MGFNLGLSKGAGLRVRYLSANAIDGPPLGIDVLQAAEAIVRVADALH